jgi:hypothetical protein
MPLQLFTANGVQFRGIKDAERAAKFTPESQNALYVLLMGFIIFYIY